MKEISIELMEKIDASLAAMIFYAENYRELKRGYPYHRGDKLSRGENNNHIKAASIKIHDANLVLEGIEEWMELNKED